MIKQISCTTMALFFIGSAFSVQSKESYIGQFLYQYKAGNVYRVTANNSTKMQWECIKGSEVGAKGEETPQRFKVSKHVFYATWVEKTGIQVSQVIDFKGMKVYSTIVDGKDRYVLEGAVVREK
jgi:phenolic acid decarboxylase